MYASCVRLVRTSRKSRNAVRPAPATSAMSLTERPKSRADAAARSAPRSLAPRAPAFTPTPIFPDGPGSCVSMRQPAGAARPRLLGKLGLQREERQQRVARLLTATLAPEHLAEVGARRDLDELVANRLDHQPRVRVDARVVDHQHVDVRVDRAALGPGVEVEGGELAPGVLHAVQR